MTSPMTPGQARKAIDATEGTTDYTWSDAHRALETIAGMREEWGVESREHFGGMATDWNLAIPFHKGRSRESAQAFIEGRKDNPGFEYRLVRRYVTQVIDGE